MITITLSYHGYMSPDQPYMTATVARQTQYAMIQSFLRQNDAVTSFWHNGDVIITSCARWLVVDGISGFSGPHITNVLWACR